MTGRIVVEGGAEPAVLQRILIHASPVAAGVGGVSTAMLNAETTVRADGTFDLRGLIGRRMVRVAGLPSGWSLTVVRVAGLDVIDEGVEVLADVTDVEVHVSAHASQILGAVVDGRGMPVRDVAVIVFPEDRLRWNLPMNRFVNSARVDVQGRFTVKALPATNYFAAIVDHLVDGEWAEEEHLERCAPFATKFSLADGETKPLTLRLPERQSPADARLQPRADSTR